jgi:hypothetical protein
MSCSLQFAGYYPHERVLWHMYIHIDGDHDKKKTRNNKQQTLNCSFFAPPSCALELLCTAKCSHKF